MIKLILKHSLLAAIAWTLIIFILCCTPGKYVPTAHWLELLSFDKLVHASIFFTLTCLWLLVGFNANKLSVSFIVFIIIGCVAYGGLLEIMQATVFSQRSGDWFDFIANTFGCLMGLWVFNKNKKRS
jgi:uncharacterized membrane protein HdeD (DUF308 family)